MCRRVPAKPSGPSAIEGTKAHEVLQAALENRLRDARVAHEDWSSLFFEELDDGRNEFYLSIQQCLDYVYSILDEYPDAQMWVEVYVDPEIESLPGQAGGYCDIAIYVPSARLLFVIDYKHGAGIAVDIEGCHQLLQYSAGFLYGVTPRVAPDAVDTVTTVIVQPRAYHIAGPIREANVTPFQVYEYLRELDEVIEDCESEDAALTPSPDACRFCDANAVCPAREEEALASAQMGFRSITDVSSSSLKAPQLLDANKLGLIRHHAKHIRKWLDDVETYCHQLAREGHHVPGSKLVETRATRKYYGSDREVARRLGALLGEGDTVEAFDKMDALFNAHPVLDRLFQWDLVPMSVAEKMVVAAYKRRASRKNARNAAEAANKAFAYLTLKQSSGNTTLVDEDDPRPAVNSTGNKFASVIGVAPPPPMKQS